MKQMSNALSDFTYELPSELVAQHPVQKRVDSRLLMLDRQSGGFEHGRFRRFPDLLEAGDLLVVNDVRVYPARLRAARDSGGHVEVLVLEYPRGNEPAPCLVKPARRIGNGEVLRLGDGTGLVMSRSGDRFTVAGQGEDLAVIVERLGEVPLPPYISRAEGEEAEEDRQRYQTVYARQFGAVAAPTAGLHFDHDLLDALADQGVERAAVTLNVGPGTFRPVRVEDIRRHRMESETYHVPVATAAAVNSALDEGRRVVAVGTTTVRALESAMEEGQVRAGEGETDLFIRPGYRFRVAGALLTNFHLPGSTLLMLVCAFAGREKVMAAYDAAVRERYRFFSYGDAMFIR